jgi:hypothetical protein
MVLLTREISYELDLNTFRQLITLNTKHICIIHMNVTKFLILLIAKHKPVT